ncbi:ScbR family autoregulator-binding transcription factor [Isoptericola aurantiacus]|uniref:ScbR family autoregulator-binding transcription factor n=1 Tax=Isoptericola aurantiacus TaxID=3377839 RepID=UPI00383A17E5
MDIREPQQQRGFERRAAVLEGAASVFEQYGYGQSSLKLITQSSGATTGSVYFYFPTKESIALAVIEEQNARTLAGFGEIIARHRGMDVLFRASRAVADALLTDVVVRAGIRLSLEQGTLAVPTAEFYRRWIDGLIAPLQDAVDVGDVVTSIPLPDLAETLIPYFTGVHVVSDVLSGRADLYRRLRTMWHLVVHSIGAADRQERLLARVDDLFDRSQPGARLHPGVSA